jgi:hypothetical protein
MIACPPWFQSSNFASDDFLSPMVSEQKAEIQLIVRTNYQKELRLSHCSVTLVEYRYSVQEDARGEAHGYEPRRDARQTGEVKLTDASLGSPEMLMNQV